MAEFLHFNDKRKVVNALFKFFRGFSQSDINSGKADDMRLRFLPVIIWLSAD
jgi:hypothetical protein